MLATVRRYRECGLSVIPTEKKTKRPTCGKWAGFQNKIPTEPQINKWFGNGNSHCSALIGGKVSGNLECLDFDLKGELYRPFMEIVRDERPDLLKTLVIERTQNSGYHVIYRCEDTVSGNTKLSQRAVEVDSKGEHDYKGKVFQASKVNDKWFIIMDLIETRGEGGYFLCAPSPGYELIQGQIENLPILSKTDRDYLINTAKSLNEWIKPTHEKQNTDFQGKPPWDDYNERNTPLKLLIEQGWTDVRRTGKTSDGATTVLLRRPGKSEGTSGSIINDSIFYCFSSNAYPFEAEKGYTAFQIYALLKHNGDFSEAAKQAYQEGYGDRQEPKQNKKTSRLEALNERYAVIKLGGKTVVMEEIFDPVFNRPDVAFLTIQDFRNFYLNDRSIIETDEGKSKSVSNAKLWLEWMKRRTYKGVVFSPERNYPGYYNLYRGLGIKPKQGNWDLIKLHIFNCIACENKEHYDYILDWMADIIQNPGGEKKGVAIVLQGKKGTGKGCFAKDIFGSVLGHHFLHITNPAQLAGKFNSHLKNTILCYADECFWAGDKNAESVLKGMITEEVTLVEPKRIDPFPVKSFLRVIVASNDDWVIPASLDERRFAVFTVRDTYQQNPKYFKPIYEQIQNGGREAMLHDLLNRKITSNLRQAPRTEALINQIEASMDPVTAWWYDRLCKGTFIDSHADWKEEISNEILHKGYVLFCDEVLGKKRKLTSNAFSRKLAEFCPVRVYKRRAAFGGKPGYDYGTLDKCRELFCKSINYNIKWE